MRLAILILLLFFPAKAYASKDFADMTCKEAMSYDGKDFNLKEFAAQRINHFEQKYPYYDLSEYRQHIMLYNALR